MGGGAGGRNQKNSFSLKNFFFAYYFLKCSNILDSQKLPAKISLLSTPPPPILMLVESLTVYLFDAVMVL